MTPAQKLAVGRAAGATRELAALIELAMSYADSTAERSLMPNALAGCSRFADRIGDDLEAIAA